MSTHALEPELGGLEFWDDDVRDLEPSLGNRRIVIVLIDLETEDAVLVDREREDQGLGRRVRLLIRGFWEEFGSELTGAGGD